MNDPIANPDRPEDLPQRARQRRGLAGLCLAMLLSSLDTSIANVAVPTLAAQLDASFAVTQWVVLAYLVAVTSFLVGAGRLGDLLGRRRLLGAGILVFPAASIACALAPSVGLLIAARALQGLGGAVMIAHTMAAATAVAPAGRAGSAMGILGTMSAIGTALGPTLGGALLAIAGWPALFWINVPLGLAAFALVRHGLPVDVHSATRPGADPFGTLLLAATLAAYALAMTFGRDGFGLGPAAFATMALVGAFAFVRLGARVAAPLVPLGLLRDRRLAPGLAMSFLVTTVVMASLVVGPFHLGGALGLDPASVGLSMSVGPIVAAMTGIPAGRLVDRIGAARMTMLGLAAMVSGALLMAAMPLRAGVLGYTAPLGVVTAGYAVFQAANNTAIVAGAPSERRGLVSGLLSLARNLGLVTGVAAMGSVFATATGSVDLAHAAPAAVAQGTRVTFAVAAGLVAIAMLLAVGRATVVRDATAIGSRGN